MNKRMTLTTLILSIGTLAHAGEHNQRHTLDETDLVIEQGQTCNFATENSRIHSKFAVTSYQLDMSNYPKVPHHQVYLVPTNYRLYVSPHAPAGTISVLGINAEGKVKTTTKITITPSQHKRSKKEMSNKRKRDKQENENALF